MFFRAFLAAPRRIGAIAPSSRGLAQRMARIATADQPPLVAELGAGTGVITRALLSVLGDDAQLYAFEIHPPFVAHLRRTLRDTRLHLIDASASTLALLAEREGLPGFDAIVSALPFSRMPRAATEQIVQAAARSLRPGGVFVALQYHPWYLLPLLRREFHAVRREVYLWNLPPALILTAR